MGYKRNKSSQKNLLAAFIPNSPWKLVIGLFLIVGIALSYYVHSHRPQTNAFSATWTFGGNVTTSAHNPLDIDPILIKDGNDLWFQYATGGFGTQEVWRFKGTTMDNLVRQPNAIRDSSFGVRPYGDDKYWIGPGWQDPATGKWHAIVHVEFNYATTWFRRLALATSIDKGARWHIEGNIITSDSSYNKSDYAGTYFNTGQGDPKLFIDTQGGYFYVYYRNDWMNKTYFDDRTASMRVARCPIASKMAPGCWQKWYNGGWTEPGLGGHETAVFPDADSVSVFYSSYLNKFIAIGNHVTKEGDFISEATDLNTQNWSPEERFSGPPSRLKWYNFAVDPTTWDKMTVGQTFRVYSSDVNTAGPTKYMLTTFCLASCEPTQATPTPTLTPTPTGVVPTPTPVVTSPTPTTAPTAVPTPTPTSIPTVTPTPTPTLTGGSTVNIYPIADAYVGSDYPTRNNGTAPRLSSDGSPKRIAYMKYDLSSLAGKRLVSAKLRIRVLDSSPGTQNMHPVTDNSWTETGITYNNRPAYGTTFKTFRATGSVYEIDVTDWLTGSLGTVKSLAIETTNSDGLEFASKNYSTVNDRVRLVLTVQ